MTHSPGPWRLAKSGQIVDVNNRAIARIWNTSKRDQDRANGELIADAPEVRRLYDELCNDMARVKAKLQQFEESAFFEMLARSDPKAASLLEELKSFNL